MDKKIENSLSAVAVSTLLVSFTLWIALFVNVIPNAQEQKAEIIFISVVLAVCISIAVYQSIKAIVLAITGAQETGKVLSPLNEKKSGHGHWPKPDGPGVAWPPPGNES